MSRFEFREKWGHEPDLEAPIDVDAFDDEAADTLLVSLTEGWERKVALSN